MKLLIFGIVASGKTTLAKALSCRLGSPGMKGTVLHGYRIKNAL